AGDHGDPVHGVVAGDAPVVRDREDVVAGAGVVAGEVLGASSPSERVECVCSPQRSQIPSVAQGPIIERLSYHSFTSPRASRTIDLSHPGGVFVEDYQEQEYEFWRRLEEESLDRRKLLRRGLAAGAGLTIFSLSDVALATRQRVLADPPLRGTKGTMKALIAAAKKEGHLNVSPCRRT